MKILGIFVLLFLSLGSGFLLPFDQIIRDGLLRWICMVVCIPVTYYFCADFLEKNVAPEKWKKAIVLIILNIVPYQLVNVGTILIFFEFPPNPVTLNFGPEFKEDHMYCKVTDPIRKKQIKYCCYREPDLQDLLEISYSDSIFIDFIVTPRKKLCNYQLVSAK